MTEMSNYILNHWVSASAPRWLRSAVHAACGGETYDRWQAACLRAVVDEMHFWHGADDETIAEWALIQAERAPQGVDLFVDLLRWLAKDTRRADHVQYVDRPTGDQVFNLLLQARADCIKSMAQTVFAAYREALPSELDFACVALRQSMAGILDRLQSGDDCDLEIERMAHQDGLVLDTGVVWIIGAPGAWISLWGWVGNDLDPDMEHPVTVDIPEPAASRA